MKVDTLILTKSLGKGAFGEVFLTKKEGNDKELYATKRMDRSESENPSNKKRLINEIGILSQIKHPNIVRLIELKADQKKFGMKVLKIKEKKPKN